MKRATSIFLTFVIITAVLFSIVPSGKAVSWSADMQITSSVSGDYSPTFCQTSDGKIWLVWVRSPLPIQLSSRSFSVKCVVLIRARLLVYVRTSKPSTRPMMIRLVDWPNSHAQLSTAVLICLSSSTSSRCVMNGSPRASTIRPAERVRATRQQRRSRT